MTNEPDVQIVGAYPLHVSEDLFEFVLHSRYGGDDDTPEQRALAIRKTHEELDRALHIVFFLHFVDPERPLRTSYGDRVIPALSPMPAHLLLLSPYEPIGS